MGLLYPILNSALRPLLVPTRNGLQGSPQDLSCGCQMDAEMLGYLAAATGDTGTGLDNCLLAVAQPDRVHAQGCGRWAPLGWGMDSPRLGILVHQYSLE